MPVHPCQINGKKGYKWGGSGKCYTGPGAKRRAGIQGAAAHAAGWKGKSVDVRDGKTDTSTVANDNSEGYRNPNRRELKSGGKFQDLLGNSSMI